jgi:hypothetical protein
MFWIVLLAVQVWIAGESEKVRPDARPPSTAAAPRIRLSAAGGECVGAQIVVRGPVHRLEAQGHTNGDTQIDLYRVATITVTQPSGPDGAIGEWPDALIPARDALFGEARKAFPIDVPERRAQAIFVEACVPRGAGGGRIPGSVKLAWEGGSLDVPVELRRRAFDLPATPTLPTAFGFSGYSAAKGHGRGPEANRELTRAYDRLALRRGITLFGGTQDAPPMRNGRIEWTAYDEEVGPFIDRWSVVELREPAGLSRDERRSYRRQWVEHFKERGWLDKLFRYVWDEPAGKDLPAVEKLASEYREDVPEVRRLVTTWPSARLPSVDLFVPLLNSGPSPGTWWYQSCMSHGCAPTGGAPEDASFRGWPTYMIDAPATAARAMGTLAFVGDVAGELYFDTVYAYDSMDPWTSQWAFAGNGDGTLFYPGTPARIGGRHDVPVESLRFVQIARGLADHAYLTLCAQLGDPALARAEARAVAPGLKSWSRDPRAYAQMREHLAARIETLLSARKLGAR